MFSSFPALLLSQGPGARQKLHPLLISPCPFAGRSSSCTNYTTTLPSTFAHFLSMTELHISEILQYLCFFFFFSAKQAAMSPRGCGRSYLPKTMALFLILEFAVAQRRPLMRMEIHFYTNQM